MLASDETLQLIKDVLARKGYIDIPAYGFSMFPYIQKGDLCRFVAIESTNLLKGDVVLYITETGQLIGHRFYDMEHTKEGQIFYLKGDSNLGYDTPLSRSDLIGKLILIQRGDKIIEASDFSAKARGKLMLSFPWLSGFLHRKVNKKRKSEASLVIRRKVQKIQR